jgi:hypothetical protein
VRRLIYIPSFFYISRPKILTLLEFGFVEPEEIWEIHENAGLVGKIFRVKNLWMTARMGCCVFGTEKDFFGLSRNWI